MEAGRDHDASRGRLSEDSGLHGLFLSSRIAKRDWRDGRDGLKAEVFGTSNPDLRPSDRACRALADFFSILLSAAIELRNHLNNVGLLRLCQFGIDRNRHYLFGRLF